VLAAYIPGGLELSFEEFAQLRTEQDGAHTEQPRQPRPEHVHQPTCSHHVPHARYIGTNRLTPALTYSHANPSPSPSRALGGLGSSSRQFSEQEKPRPKGAKFLLNSSGIQWCVFSSHC
jgi:hypothetical protein